MALRDVQLAAVVNLLGIQVFGFVASTDLDHSDAVFDLGQKVQVKVDSGWLTVCAE